jgi:branched-chain amino acid transport system ATP-binding protein
MLRVSNLVVDIQGSRVLRGVSIEVGAGELVCLVGRNGAGKTTTFRTIMGFFQPVHGAIAFGGRDVTGCRPHQMAKHGIGYAPEESDLFGELTVAENIAMPTWTRPAGTCPGGRDAQTRINDAWRVFPGLARYRDRGGHTLSGGERKMVSIARALALDPKLLLLDEPIEGLSPAVVPQVLDGLAGIRALGRAILIAESNFHHVPDADRIYVIERGEIVFAGTPAAARQDEAVARIIEGTPPPIDARRMG